MARFLPPLNALRAFEAAARHLSFTRAATELNVTQAAISHQVKALEDRLGLRLFRRLTRELRLTEEGQAYLPAVRDAFDRLAAATERLRRADDGGVLTVSMLPSFGARWVVPRLKRFRVLHPDIDVRIHASVGVVDFARDNVDMAIRFGRGRYPGLRADRLLTEEVFPVCSPALLKGLHPLRRPEDLRHHTLLHDDLELDWPLWFKVAGVRGVDASRGPGFTDSSMALQAAIEGLGVLLGRSALAAEALARGQLVRPFATSIASDWAYYIVSPEAAAERPKIAAFREWLMAEAAGQPGAAAASAPARATKGNDR